MYLIDTSVWIDFFRSKNNSSVDFFNEILDKKWPFSITGIIYQEILQGATTKHDFDKLTAYLGSQHFVQPEDFLITHQQAAYLYLTCQGKGITIRSTIDCFIAQVAIENDLILLHHDKDFINLNKVIPALKILPSY